MTHAVVLLRLGRVSNLPTVWSNGLAGMALAGAAAGWRPALVLLPALSLMYVAGMFLNDWFDREFDARHRPDRPIPAGEASAATVAAWGGGLLVAGLAMLAALGPGVLAPGVGLALAVLLYDAWHKGNPVAPLVMGACRGCCYLVAAAAAGGAMAESAVLAGAALLILYVWMLSLIARQAGSALTARLIAGISLIDALLLCLAGWPELAPVAIACFLLTLTGQRLVQGT